MATLLQAAIEAEAATLLQAAAQGTHARREAAVEAEAATLLQAAARGVLTRRELKALLQLEPSRQHCVNSLEGAWRRTARSIRPSVQ